ncbi:tetratricopeptide repeat protein [Desulfohalobium retbaense]|uniref:TPR repeat-containing protein n=1 Tax=Desulfohalobium retbaense (strain ATCC 49708 / DSM 5692 / JCM 16813 / HR100) TaxID=485915 RepID=C8X1M3_DESRD|nr:tetratricopeptide repeat protein [Desulfohalobium retbaense]ACV68445.1 TPR repeat-containing protein [Desulfohalobium retbaense DSM 5692]
MNVRFPYRFSLLAETLAILLLLLTASGCATLPSSSNGGWWGSKQDREVITNEDIRQKLCTPRPLSRGPGFHFDQGVAFQGQGEHRLAIREFNKVLNQEPEHIKALNAKGVCLDRLGRFEQSIASYQAALELNPKLAYIHNNLGFSYYLQGKYRKAVEAYKKAISLNGNKSVYNHNLGLAYAQMGNFDQALAQFRTGGPSEPENTTRKTSATAPAADKDEALFQARVSEQERGQSDISKHVATTTEAHTGQTQTPIRPATEPTPSGQTDLSSGQTSDALEMRMNTDAATDSVPHSPEVIAQSPHQQEQQKEVRPDFAVQAGAFTYQRHAAELYFQLQERGYDAYIKKSAANGLYLVRVGEYSGHKEAKIAARSLSRVEDVETLATKEIDPCARTTITAAAKFEAVVVNQKDTLLQQPVLAVLNGNGVRHMARQTGQYLQDQGYSIGRIGNASHFNHTRTTIYYSPEMIPEAQSLAARLPEKCKLKPAHPLAMPTPSLRIIVGLDLVAHKKHLLNPTVALNTEL